MNCAGDQSTEQSSVKRDDQKAQDDGEHCLDQSSIQLFGVKSVTSEAKTHVAPPPNLIQCELLYFVVCAR